ncbi:Ubiquitin [Oryctes borbonicus]|uniref:Ubiquitin n=1 Tax=Oryctes borbonicus TaxID=1629725 RepID=A0A0T6B2F6_9SCAR|nr:Ubiquitin [Oryctes borbonicus]
MDRNIETEDIFIQIRDKLHKDTIKLWLPPYYNSVTGPEVEEIKQLAMNYSTSLNLSYELCYNTLQTLQSNAFEKLNQINRFKESGLATIKIKILQQSINSKIVTKEVYLSISGSELKALLCDDIKTPQERVKLISGGRIVKDEHTLKSQGFKNTSQVLAVVLNESVTNLNEDESRVREIESTKADTSLLALDDGYMQLEDQCGNSINIPIKERKALMVAMALHEKGRAALKEHNYAKALVFFLDADKEFSQCNSQLLNNVDNYALLNLDIAWCYLCLQSFMHLPEAHERLKKCEENFHKSYGPNLERLIALKGSTGNEAALFMRLHLLQAIVLYHQNERPTAKNLLLKANNELLSLKVDEHNVLALIELGYSPAEARLGLRATNGDINMAANYINEKRNAREESRRKAMAERIFKKESQKLGLCVDGKQYVDPNFLKILVNMGFGKEAARIALQKTNNIISDSIQYIQENPLPGPSNSKSREFLSLIEELIPELQAAGFDYSMSKLALQKHNGDVMRAAEELLINNGIINAKIENEPVDEVHVTNNEHERKLKELKEDALNRLSQDISMEDDDYLDLTLQKEEMFLKQYLALLEND